MIHRSDAATGTQCGSASAPDPTAMLTSSHTTIAWLLSVRVSTRTVIADTA